MKLIELSTEYKQHAEVLANRLKELQQECRICPDRSQRRGIEDRMRLLSTMQREARELAVLTERYYERGYRRNVKYTL